MKTREEVFIERLAEVHPDYRLIGKYTLTINPILIKDKYGICRTMPNPILKGGRVTIASAVNKTRYFINRAIEIHGLKYDYSKVEYTKMVNKVTIICKEHGEFKQSATGHLKGNNCPICAKKYRIKTYKKNKGELSSGIL